MRALALVTAVLGLAVTGSACADATSRATSLRITYWEDSSASGTSVTWTLRCGPARGSLARPARACRKLAVGGAKLFAPLPPDGVCTQIYGGPQRARVVGRVQGKRVWATFTRRNGCEIGRWQRISPWLVPRGGVTS